MVTEHLLGRMTPYCHYFNQITSVKGLLLHCIVVVQSFQNHNGVFVEPLRSFFHVPLSDSEMKQLKEILETVEASDGPSTSSSWSLRQSAAQDEWQKERPCHLDCLLFSRVVREKQCSQCSSPAIIRCRDCMPEEWLCMECDLICHKKLVLHNRESCIDGVYRPIPPTVCCEKENGRYTLKNQGTALIILVKYQKIRKSFFKLFSKLCSFF